MKTRFQKLMSLILVLVMLITMIPAGMFVATAEVSAELAAGLADYDNTAEFVINNVDDWEAIAASGKNFTGKTVKLGADIDAAGATLSTLAPFAVDNSGIILDGQGFAIKNVGTATDPQTEPLVSGKFSGGTVKNVTFQNIVMVGADATYGSGLIADWLNGWGTVTVQNVKVLGCDISDTAGSAGALFGRTINNNGDAKVIIDGVVIDAGTKITSATAHAGGVIGYISGNGGTYTITRVYTEATVKAPAATGYAGGLVGYVNGHTSYNSQFNFTHNVVKGTLTSDGGSSWTGRIGAICGRATTAVDINVSNCVLAPDAVTSGLVLCQAITAANGSQDVSVTGSYKLKKFVSDFYFENSSSTLDGVAHASGHNYDLAGIEEITDPSLHYTLNDNGFVASVHEEQVAPPPAAPEGVSEELEAALADYENCAEFVINNVDDWNYFAAFTAKNNKYEWEGKTVKLGANIDAQGATLPTLFAAHNTRALFDGQGYSIKNVGTVASPNTAALFSADTGNVGFKGDIQNLTLNNVIVSGSGSAKALLVEWVNADTETAFKNIKVLNCSVTNESGPAAAIVGRTSATGNAYGVLFENILVSGSTITGASVLKYDEASASYITGGWNATGTAALCGYFTWNAGDTGATARNIEVVNTTITDATPLPEGTTVAPAHVAGLFGYYRMNAGVGLTIENVYVNATLQTPNAGSWTGVAAGLFRTDNSSTSNTITIKNAITNNVYPGIVQIPTLFYAPVATFVTENLYSVQKHEPEKSGWLVNGGNTVNGTEGVLSNYAGVSATIVAVADVATMITRGGDGFITAITAPTETPVPGPGEGGSGTTPDPEPTEELVIDSVAKWNEIAASEEDYSNYKVLLGADLDFEGATISPLFKVAFGGIFDGQGYTIKNVGTTDAPSPYALIAYKLGAATIKNVTFENIVLNGTGVLGMISGSMVLPENGTALIENIKVLGCTVTGGAATGSLLGTVNDTDANCTLTIRSVTIDENTKVTGGATTGGLAGEIANVGTLNIFNVYTKATVTGLSDDHYVGGLVGETNSTGNGIINIINFYNGGNLVSTNNAEKVNSAGVGGVLGRFTGSAGKTITLKNILLDCQFLETNKRATAWIGTMHGQGYLYYDNIMTTNSTGSSRPKPQWKLIAVNSNTMINGKPMNGEIPSPSAGDLDDLLFVEEKIARTLAVVDEETGFLKSVNALVEAYTYQYSEVIDGKFSIRFVGTSQLMTEETILMHVKATTASGKVKNFTVQSPGMEKLFPFDEHNISESIVAEEIGVQKMLSVTVFDIPVGEAITFEFWVTMAMPSGAVVTSTQTITVTFDATGAPVVAA